MLKRSAQHGFTLIELLVVISIIALLIAILLPALGAARQSARATECLSRMRSLAIAIGTYETENKGYLPPGFNGDSGFALAGGGTGDARYFSDYLDEYLETAPDEEGDFYLCPDSTLEPAETEAHRLSYSTNDKVLVNRLDNRQVRLSDVFRPTEVISVGDAAQNSGNGTSGPTYTGTWIFVMLYPPDEANRDVELAIDESLNVDGVPGNGYVIRYRHNSDATANHAYLDGHASPARIGELVQKNIAANY